MGYYYQHVVLVIAFWLSSTFFAYALPTLASNDDVSLFNQSHPFEGMDIEPSIYARQSKVALRIMPLGASIMSGVGSSNGNGLRKPLRDALRLDGWDVNMVGSFRGGSMKDSDHEAVPGDIITQIRTRMKNNVGYKPNVIIINGGTNDAIRDIDPNGSGDRMNDILNDIWGAEDMADTCVMLSTIIPTNDATGSQTRLVINERFRALVTKRAQDGKCIYLAEMDPNNSGWITWDEFASGESVHVHPNDEGHRKMAASFYKAINEAANDGKIKEAGAFKVVTGACDKFGGNGVDAGGLTQRGSGTDDGIYSHESAEMGIRWTFDSDWDRDQWRFARLFSRDYDDLLAWINKTETEHIFAVWANSADGQGSFNKINDMSGDMFCIPRGLRFIDFNGDGLDDLACIDQAGNLYLSINQGDGDRAAGRPPTFKRVSDSAKIKDTEGYAQDRVVLADIDGDGRADYGIIDDSGNVHFWRNGWIDDIPKYWQALGLRFTAKGMGDVRGVRFEDINGDGRDDWLWVGNLGETTTWTNARSCAKGAVGDGLNVAWRQGFYKGESSGPTHKGMAGFATADEDYLRPRIHFARIYGESSAFGNLGKQDYVFMQHEAQSNGKHRFNMRVWKNKGTGGTKLLADGNKYCNMVGHDDGRDDYVWTWSTGKMELFINRGKRTVSDSDADGYWDPSPGVIWNPPRDMNRRDLHLADWDGDGDCDIIYVDPNTNAVEVFLNEYPQKGSWEWTHLANPAPGLTCPYKRGLVAVRFGDLTGNGRADYLCLAPDGKTSGYVHKDDGSFENVGQIKFSEEKDRANFRWVDVNGDGLDDMIWIEKFTGDTFVWYNGGRSDPASTGGSSFFWRRQDARAYDGLAAGTCLYYPDLDGNGRADEHFILGTFNNQARTSLNPSCGMTDSTGDDDSMSGDLPEVPDTDPEPITDTPPDPTENCGAPQKFMAPFYSVGNTGSSSETFCAAKWNKGVFPTVIEARADVNSLRYLRVKFTDGTEVEYGVQVGDDGHHRMGTMEWDPWSESFSEFSLWAGGWNGVVGRLKATVSSSKKIDAGAYWDNPPEENVIDRGQGGEGMLLGFFGTSGDAIDSLQPYFSSARPLKTILRDATFEPSFEELNEQPFEQRQMNAVQASHTFTNRRTEGDVTMGIDVFLITEQQFKSTFSHEGGKEWGGEVGGTIGGEIVWKSGIPVIAQSEAKGKVEVTGKYVMKNIVKDVTGTEESKLTRHQLRYTLTTVVKPGQRVMCTAVAIQSKVNLRYSATLELVFKDGQSYTYPVVGQFQNAESSEAISYCEDVDINDEDVSSQASFDVTESGTYCQDGKRVGDQGMTDAELLEACPI